MDERADTGQREALTIIFGGQAGGYPAVLCSIVGQVLGVKAVPIEYRAAGKRRSISIPTLAAAEIEALRGQGDAEVPLPITREISGKNGFYSPFEYQA
ncbi:MAG TPA: DUF1326 domain-containing protein [Bryobacteraceae bacterium]|nr:DUF1326 domain-containing protein [Bryobacteraceae bacterium]